MEHFGTLERDTIKLFPTCFDTNEKIATLKAPSVLSDIAGHLDTLFEARQRQLEGRVASLNVNGLLDQLKLWHNLIAARQQCEVCAMDLGVSLFRPSFGDVDVEFSTILGFLASCRICKEHKPDPTWVLALMMGQFDRKIYGIIKDPQYRSWFRPGIHMTPCYIPDTLIEIATVGSTLTVKELISHTDITGRSLLHQALDMGLPKVIKRIVADNSMDMTLGVVLCNQKDDLGRTPLHVACLKNNADAVQQLLQWGASPTKKTSAGLLPLHFAAAIGSTEICPLLMANRRVRCDTAGPDGKNARDYALINNNFMVAQTLRFNGSIVNSKLELDLLRAILQGSASGVRAALRAGASPNASFNHAISGSKQAQSALMFALLEFEDYEIAEILLIYGVNLEARTTNGKATALHLCAQPGKDFELDWLLNKGADIMARDSKGRTALMRAAQKDSPMALDILIHFANLRGRVYEMVHARDKNDQTAVDYAIWYKNDSCRKILERENSIPSV